jgi:K(+)-stimulated pyrophosphate-energized sodium pump
MILNIWIIPIVAIIGILFVIYLRFRIMSESTGDNKMRVISNAIREGALAFLKREYQILALYLVVMAAVP